MKNPTVSIIVPCYNQAQYLEECLQSVLKQSYRNWECIVVNDGSPDNTEKVVRKWIEKDSRFKYLYQENKGVSSARNYGIYQAIGKFILPLDADDKISSKYLELAINEFHGNNKLKVVYCKAEKFGEEIGKWELPEFSLQGLSRNNMIFCSALFEKNEWESVQGYDVNMKAGLEDYEFWIALLKKGGQVIRLEEVGFYYRIKGSSRQVDLKNKETKALFEYISVKHADFFVKYYGSFKKMEQELEQSIQQYEDKLKSEKFVIDAFCSTFLGFSVFGKYKKESK